jgi:hypothetical protein
LALPAASDSDFVSVPIRVALGGRAMISDQLICTPSVRFFSGKSESFFQFGSEWKRATSEDEAHAYTGFDRITLEPSVGVYVTRRPNGLMRIGFDLWRLGVNLQPAVIERLQNRWRKESASLSKSILRSAGRRSHFSKSFMRFEISPEQLEGWKAEFESVLSDPASFEPPEGRTTANG